jgi:hypothetical protein
MNIMPLSTEVGMFWKTYQALDVPIELPYSAKCSDLLDLTSIPAYNFMVWCVIN